MQSNQLSLPRQDACKTRKDIQTKTSTEPNKQSLFPIFVFRRVLYARFIKPNIIMCKRRYHGQFRVLSTRIIPAAGNGESCLAPVFRPFSNSHQYWFQIRLRLVDISAFSGQNKVTKICPKYLLTRYSVIIIDRLSTKH